MSFENKVGKLKEAIKNSGGFDKFVQHMLPKLLNAKEGEKPLMQPEDFSIKELFEAVNTSQFPIITGTLVSKKVIQGFTEYPGIADQLVTKFTSKLKTDTIPGAFLKGDLEDIPEGGGYPHSGDIEEFFVTISGAKRGEILDITDEAIRFDQTGLIMLKASKFGQRAAKDREKSVIYTILDATVDGKNYHAYYPGGTRTALYRTSNGASGNVGGGVLYKNAITDALADYTDLDAAEAVFDDVMDENGDPIDVMQDTMILLTARALKGTATRLTRNQMMPLNSGSSVGYHETNPYYQLKTLFSPWIDKANGSAYWYYGNFKKQFLEKVVIPLQVLTRRDDKNDAAWERDVIAQYKVRRFSKVGAIDHRYVVESTGAG